MKRLLLSIAIILLISLTACGTDSGDTNDSLGDTPTECSHIWDSATCTEPQTCTKCNITKGSALGHTTYSGICSRCGENFSSWRTGEYTDEFDQPTGKKYMVTESYGTFSNSATTDSKLYAAVQIDKNNIAIMMWEYGNYLLKGTFDYEDYKITILDENGTKHYFTGTIYKGGTRIYFDSADRNAVLNLLRNNDTLKIYLKSTKYSISTYLFTIETKGFATTYNSIIK